MITLGIDIGSSFIKASIYDTATGGCLARSQSPASEMGIISMHPGWAEQSPEMWWAYTREVIARVIQNSRGAGSSIRAIGITYQMHGLVCLDKEGKPLRPSIIWCDSRAVKTGNLLEDRLGKDYCLNHLFNSPGNFTASKLRWVMDHEPETYEKIHRIMLPGDYIGYRLTGEMVTTVSGLSEGIFWDFRENRISGRLLEVSGISANLLPSIVPVFGIQGRLLPDIARELGLTSGIPLSYRAGDQPNNAFSLNVLHPGEIAATAGTSGVVYGVTSHLTADPFSRVNTFIHVNHTPEDPRFGVLLCINGTGCLNSWLRHHMAGDASYASMNEAALKVPAGSDGLMILPFGNGAERMLKNSDPGCSVVGLDFNRHGNAHFYRAAQEGIAFAFRYGIEVMKESGLKPEVIRAGHANMFLSPLFCQTLADLCQVRIDIYNTDGSVGAAIGAAVGAGFYSGHAEAFSNIRKMEEIGPSAAPAELEGMYQRWKDLVERGIV